MYTLQVDKREQSDYILDLLLEQSDESGFVLFEQNQDVGDYCWYNEDGSHTGIAVELKLTGTNDFYKSLRNGHLDSQMVDMGQFTHPFLVICGPYNSVQYRGIFTRKQFIAKIASIGVRTGVKPVWFERETDAVQFICQLPYQLAKGERCDVIAVRHKYTKNRLDYNLNQFLSLPAIGEKRALELHGLFPTFLEFLQTVTTGTVDGLPKETYDYVAAITGSPLVKVVPLYKQFKEVPGIGEKSALELAKVWESVDVYYEAVKTGNAGKVPKRTLEHILGV